MTGVFLFLYFSFSKMVSFPFFQVPVGNENQQVVQQQYQQQVMVPVSQSVQGPMPVYYSVITPTQQNSTRYACMNTSYLLYEWLVIGQNVFHEVVWSTYAQSLSYLLNIIVSSLPVWRRGWCTNWDSNTSFSHQQDHPAKVPLTLYMYTTI